MQVPQSSRGSRGQESSTGGTGDLVHEPTSMGSWSQMTGHNKGLR